MLKLLWILELGIWCFRPALPCRFSAFMARTIPHPRNLYTLGRRCPHFANKAPDIGKRAIQPLTGPGCLLALRANFLRRQSSTEQQFDHLFGNLTFYG